MQGVRKTTRHDPMSRRDDIVTWRGGAKETRRRILLNAFRKFETKRRYRVKRCKMVMPLTLVSVWLPDAPCLLHVARGVCRVAYGVCGSSTGSALTCAGRWSPPLFVLRIPKLGFQS